MSFPRSLSPTTIGERESITMPWYPSLYRMLCPKPRYVWCPVQILRETEKAILVDNGGKSWVPKSQIWGIRLRDNTFYEGI